VIIVGVAIGTAVNPALIVIAVAIPAESADPAETSQAIMDESGIIKIS